MLKSVSWKLVVVSLRWMFELSNRLPLQENYFLDETPSSDLIEVSCGRRKEELPCFTLHILYATAKRRKTTFVECFYVEANLNWLLHFPNLLSKSK